MYKFITVILSFILAISLSACGYSKENIGVQQQEILFTGEIDGEITVSIYETMKYKVFLDEAARLFQEKYPGTTVNIETFSAMPDIKTSEQDGNHMLLVEYKDDPQDRQNYINKVNTALMSGEGADIFAIDILPFYKYADVGLLENLEDYIQSDPEFNKIDYRMNILDALKYKNGIWFLPTDYTFNYYTYDSTLLASNNASNFGTDKIFTSEKLITLASPYFNGDSHIFNKPDYDRSPRSDMWDLLLDENYTSFVDIENQKVNFNDGNFAKLLETTKWYSEQGYIPKGENIQADDWAAIQKSDNGSTDRLFFKYQNIINLISLFTRDLDIKMTAMTEGDIMTIGDDDEIAGIASSAKGSVPFTYEQAYGINSNSKNKETAWAFLCFLLSEEIQLNPNLSPTSLPISNYSRNKKMEILLTSIMEQQGQSLKETHFEAIDKYNETVEKLSDQIETYIIKDTLINDIISTEIRYFFEGTKTSEEVSDILQNKVNLYLNE